MSKKAVIIISVLAFVFTIAAGAGLFLTNGRIEEAMDKMKPLSAYADAGKLKDHPFQAYLVAPAKAREALDKRAKEIEEKSTTVSANETKIAQLTTDGKQKDDSIADLQTRNTSLTRDRDESKSKLASLSTQVEGLESQVKSRDGQIAEMSKTNQEKADAFEKQVAEIKTKSVTDGEKLRSNYAALHNWIVTRGINPPFSADPGRKVGDEVRAVFAPAPLVAQVLAFDSRQGVIIVNIGPSSGLTSDRGFDLLVADKVIAKVTLVDSSKPSISTLAYLPVEETMPNLTPGTPIKLRPFFAIPAATPASIAPVTPVAPAPTPATTTASSN